MIKYFSVENFSSIKDEIIFEADIGCKKLLDTNKAFVVFGSNASGKTNFLKAITFLFWFMRESFFTLRPGEKIPFDTFITKENEPTKFYVEFIIKNNLYKYTLELNKKEVLYEKLEKNRLKKPIYERDKNKIYAREVSKKTLKDLPSNVSIISFLSRFRTQKFAKEIYSYNIVSNVTYFGLRENTNIEEKIAKEIIDSDIKKKALEILKIADTGIVDFSLIDSISDKDLKTIKELKTDSTIENNIEKNEIKKLKLLLLSKLLSNKTKSQVFFLHDIEGKEVEFNFMQESDGTKKLFLKLKDIITITQNGGILIFDEIDSQLHFKIVEYIVSLFKSSQNAQLICASHSPTIIDRSFDAKTLWFTQKENGITNLYCANDFEDLKKDMSLQKLYEIGRFGAVPKAFYPKQ